MNKHYRLHLFIFFALSFQLFLFAPVVFISRILAVVLCAAVFLRRKRLGFAFMGKSGPLLFFLVNAYLTFAFFGFDLFFQAGDLRSASLLRLYYLGSGFLWTAYVLNALLGAVNDYQRRFPGAGSAPADGILYWRKWLALSALLFAVFTLWLLAYNPVVMSYDSWEYIAGWRGYLGGWRWQEGSFLIGRSIPYVFLVSLICRFAPSVPEVMWIAVAQNVAFSSILSTVLMYFHRKGIPFGFLLPFALFLPLIPSFGLHTVVVWCDLACGISFLWLAYVSVRILDEALTRDRIPKGQLRSLCVQLCLSLVLVCFARPNTFPVYLIAAPVLALLFLLKKQWKLFAATALSAVLVLLIRFPGYRALGAAEYEHLAEHRYFAAMHDMHAAYYGGGNFSERTLAALKKYIPLIDDPSTLNRFYPDWVVKDHYELGNLTTKEFLSMYIDSFVRNPVLMFKSMLYRSRIYWVVDPKAPINGVNYTDIYDPSTGSYLTQAPDIGVYRRTNALTGIMDRYCALMDKTLPATFVWRLGVWTAVMVVCMAALFSRGRRLFLLPYLPVFLYLATLFITSGWTDYRYGLPVFFTGLFLPPACFLTGD